MAAEASPGRGAAPRPGLLQSLRNLAATLVAVAQTRLELLATEFEEERIRLTRLWLYAVVALIAGSLGMLAFTLFMIFLFWDTHRLLVTGLLALVYFALAGAFALAARRGAAEKSRLFSASIAELAKDRERLTRP